MASLQVTHVIYSDSTFPWAIMSRNLQPLSKNLPLDIARLIFEEAAQADLRTAKNIALVSRDALAWSVQNGSTLRQRVLRG